jgi:F-type H+-transporting ATPase subunit delta
MSDRNDLYADAFLAVMASEGSINETQDELFRLGRLLDGNDELRNALGDPHLPAAKRQQIVEDLLDGRAGKTTVGLVSLLTAVGRVRELSEIVDRVLGLTAARGDKVVADVRSAVELDEDQRQRLAASIKAATGKDVDVVVTVDPSVLGGIVTQIGDTVIDGSVRSRLSKLRESF